MVQLFATVQNQPKEVQLLSLAASFIIMSEALGFATSDAYTAITQLMKDTRNASGRESRFDAMKYHVETELNGEQVHVG